MELKKIEDALTGSEYADVQGFTGLKVRFVVDHRVRVPQLFDSPFRRVVGRGLPFNPLGIVSVPIAVLPEGLQGLVQVDDLMGSVEDLVKAKLAELKATTPSTPLEKIKAGIPKLEGEEPTDEELLEQIRAEVGTFCVAGPGPEGVELDGSHHNVRDLVTDMRYRNKPEDLLFLGREIEVELSGERASSIKSAIDLKAKPMRSTGEKRAEMHRGYGGTHEQMMRQAMRGRCMPHLHISMETDFAPAEARIMAWYTGNDDVRRQKFALTATKITLV